VDNLAKSSPDLMSSVDYAFCGSRLTAFDSRSKRNFAKIILGLAGAQGYLLN
jgi:hypothetical protein